MDRLEREAREVLTGYREGDRMPAARKDAAWGQLQGAIAQGEAAGDGLEDMSEAPLHARAGWRRQAAGWAIAALIAAAVVLVLVGIEAVVGEREPGDARHQAVHGAADLEREEILKGRRPGATAAAQDGETVPVVEQEVAAKGAAPGSQPVTRTPTSARPEPRAARGDVSDLDAELALLRRARAALSEGRATEALALVDEHARRFSAGHLVEERALLRVQALCETGAQAQARAEAQAFARAQPGSPHANKIIRVCDEGPTDASGIRE